MATTKRRFVKKNELLLEQRKFVNKYSFNKKFLLAIPFLIIMFLFMVIPLAVMIVYSLKPQAGTDGVSDNWGILTGTIGIKIGKSLYISLVTSIFCLLVGFPFSYFLSISKKKLYKIILFVLISSPIWINVLIKLIGLKTLFDIIGGGINSTYGDIFTIIGLVYLYLPFVMIPIYNSLEILPKNLINASKDLGRGNVYTFFHIVIPWTKQALISSLVLVTLPAFTTVAVPAFLNNNNDAGMIGDVIVDQGESGLSNPIALSRTSVLALIVSGIMFALYGCIVWVPKLVRLIIRKKASKYEKN